MAIVQYTVFPASENFAKDRSRFKEALAALTSAEGHIGSFSGLQVEEEGSKNRYFITVWESVEHQKKFRESANEKLGEIYSFLKDAVPGEIVRHQFTLIKGTPLLGLESKNTELVIITPKDGVPFDRVKEIALKVRDVWDANGHPSAISEGNGMILNIVGWTSTAHHLDTVKEEPYASIVNEFSAIGNFDMAHANLEKQN
ncbi:hypothetical protein BT96DRAFT_997832 [Gymnopus androsaceus JB14]|uniref:ABM domain-containing protein n=1 Tax=Gymnopus androsaceus JB14 TaxID=1447944 RepID=A0A6A4HAG1_9AGAR|nr:hypothetical protein BT96DRAFT_997832 [Gymnopus androsaceus JB14]